MGTKLGIFRYYIIYYRGLKVELLGPKGAIMGNVGVILRGIKCGILARYSTLQSLKIGA